MLRAYIFVNTVLCCNANEQCYFSFEKFRKVNSDQKFGRRQVVLFIFNNSEKKKVSERRTRLRPSEKQLPERRSGASRHQSTPASEDINNCRLKGTSQKPVAK
jgi:hypothetical protein